MENALGWIEDNCSGERVTICTDSLSLCLAMEAMNPVTDKLLNQCESCNANITIQWVPAHTGVEGNEMADETAKQAAKLESSVTGRATSFSSACAVIRSSVKDPTPMDPADVRICEIYKKVDHKKEQSTINNREEQVHLARIRSGHHPDLMYWQNKIDPDVSNMCPRCKEGPDTIEHWLRGCPALSAMRQRIFGTVELDDDVLATRPKEILVLAKKTFIKDDSAPQESS